MAEVQGDEGTGEGAVAPAADVVSATLSYLARALVGHPDEVSVRREDGERGAVYRLHVHPDDLGRVIGRGGRIARSIRQVTRAAAGRAGVHARIEIGD